jgi:hypothetical protein
MNEIHFSDWTLVAFKRREEERRRKEQSETALARAKEEIQRRNDTLRSDWTVAALQKRFVTLEQRVAALEQKEEERRVASLAALVPPQEGKAHGGGAPLGDSALVSSSQRDEGPATPQAEPSKTKIELEELKTVPRPDAQWLEREEAEVSRREATDRLSSDHIEMRPVRDRETVPVRRARRMAQAFISFIITASIAGAIGFGTAIYVVPVDKAAKFHALVTRTLDRLSGASAPQEKQ